MEGIFYCAGICWEKCSRNCTISPPQGQFIVACALYEAITMCKRVHCDSDSLKACLEMLFVDISGETAVPGDEPLQLWLG